MNVYSTSGSLLSRARAQDRQAWERLVELYAPLCLHWIQRQGVRGADAEDVLQETFRAAANGIHAFGTSPGKHNFRAWLRTVARSRVANHFQKQARLPNYETHSQLNAHSQPDWEEHAEDRTEEALKRAILGDALTALRAKVKPATYRAFELTVLQGQSAQSAADELGMTPGGVRVAKSRMLARLRAELGDRE